MATLDLRDPELRAKYGLRQEGVETVFRRSKWYKELKQEHRGRVETKRLILQVLSESRKPLSRSQIVRAIGRVNSPHFRDVIAEMVALGQIIEHETSFRHLPMFLYEVAS